MSGSDDVDAYLADVPVEIRQALQELRLTIKQLVPDAQEQVSYGIPIFFLHGMLVGYGANKTGCSFYTLRPKLISLLKDDLVHVDASGGTIRFPADQPLPNALVEKIVARRLGENLGV
ncbi:MAG: hypothetical protein JWP70_951 [Leifsonia sp.]|jgi:uncharacterized protein YdhG (YjbR/CyaY superfamily)|nr:hypothetical protein [Leifsonia sp.]MDQ1587304.1 hypothetical protein [Microbacteriaceae bacterium]